VYNRDRDSALARTDLATGATTTLAGGVADFQATATHVLIQSDVDPDVAPMHVLDVATGELAYIGLYHADEDKYYSARSTTGRSWGFDPTGRYVMHMASTRPRSRRTTSRAGRRRSRRTARPCASTQTACTWSARPTRSWRPGPAIPT
jgi:hypothetical protein